MVAVAGSLGGGVFEPVQEVAVVDGDHDLGAESSRGGECVGGEGYLAGADEAVEELLGPGPPVEAGIRIPATPGSTGPPGSSAPPAFPGSPAVAGSGAGVGGGVHHGQEVFVLVGCGEDFHVVQSAAGRAEEGALPLAEFVFGRFGAVLVDRFSPAAGDAGEEVGVVLCGGAGQGVFHPGGGVLGGVVPDAVQREGDDRRGAGRDGPRGEGGSEFRPFWRLGVAGDPGPGKHRVRELIRRWAFADTDPEPGTQELGSVPAPIIGRRGRDRRSWCSGLDSQGGEAGVASCGGIGSAMRPGSVGFRECFGAVVPPGDPGPAAGAGGCCGGDGLGARAVHRAGTEDLQVLDCPRQILDLAGVLGGFDVVSQGQNLRSGRCGRLHDGDRVREPGSIRECCRFSQRSAEGV